MTTANPTVRTTVVWADKAGSVYIGRGRNSPFGNRHVIGLCVHCSRVHDRKAAIAAYKRDFYLRLETEPHFKILVLALNGQELGCPGNCAPGACHGDVIAEYLNGLEAR